MFVAKSIFRQVNYSKTLPPKPHPLYFRRKRLLERLEKIADHKYTLLQAPEGYGKSSLLSNWYHSVEEADNNQEILWFRIDCYDKEPTCFWGNLIIALKRHWPELEADVLNRMDLLEQSSPYELVLSVANHIVQNSDKSLQYTLIFDDFECFKLSDSEGQFFLFADMLPANVNIVIASTEYLNNKLIEQDAYRQFILLDVPELAISKNEIRAFFDEKGKIEISDQLLDLIYTKTEGWPLALYLLLEQVDRGMNLQKAAEELSGTNRVLRDSIFSKITEDLPQKVLVFLLETSFFEVITDQLCNYVFGNKEAFGIIKHLERSGLFIFTITAEKTWYRYHYLFGEWLRDQAMSLHRDQMRALNHKAAQWYRNNDKKLLSAKYVVIASEGNFISELAKCVYTDSPIKDSSLLTWLHDLREKDLREDPFFCLLAAWSYAFSGKPNDARAWLQKAKQQVNRGVADAAGQRLECALNEEKQNDAREELVLRMSSTAKVLEAKCATLEGKTNVGIEASEELLTNRDAPLDNRLKMVLYQNQGESYELNGDISNASKLYQRAMTIAQANKYDFLVGFTRYQIISLIYVQGRLTESEQLCRVALMDCPPDFTVYGALYSMLGLIKIMQNKFDDLEVLLKRAFGRVSPDRNIDIYLDACIARGQYYIAKGNYSEALLQLEVAQQAIRENDAIPPRGTAPFVYVMQAQLYVKLKDYGSASDALREYRLLGYPETAEGDLLCRMIETSIKIEKQEEQEESFVALESLANDALERRYILPLIDIYLMSARHYHYCDKHSEAIKHLKKAIELSKREQIILPFLKEGEIVRLLLAELIGLRGLNYESDKFVRKVITAFESSSMLSEGRRAGTHWSSETPEKDTAVFVDHWNLTNREREVLQLLVRGMNRKEIASELCTSQNTIKTHISHIYEKMNVHSVSELLKKMIDHEAL